MPHLRSRHLLAIFSKRLKLWPVVGLLGARQVGKSTLLRDHLAKIFSAAYVTLDKKETRDRAQRKPSYFLEEFLLKHIIIDEVQKAPDLFDAIKQTVDERRVPGRFILSGSTEFSKKTGIRESLTGRIGILRLHPLTLAETQSLPYSHSWVKNRPLVNPYPTAKVMQRIKLGGMPGICFLRSEDERRASFDAWLDTTCYRDLQQIRGAKLNGDLAYQILQCLAKAEMPTIAHVADQLKQDARRVKSHIEALQALFVIIPVLPHVSGVGKVQYFIFDSGLVLHLQGGERQSHKAWILNEVQAQYEASGHKARIFHYQSTRKSEVDFVIEDKSGVRGVILTDDESPSTYVFRTAQAFLKKNPKARTLILAPVQTTFNESEKITVVPMTCMV